MLLQARPLYDNLGDSRFFVRPPIWDSALRALGQRRLNVLVLGGRGLGKTTLLRQLQFQLREDGERVAFVDGSGVGDVTELAERIRDAMLGQPGVMEAGLGSLSASLGSRTAVAGASRQLAQILEQIGQAEPTIVMIDGSSAGPALYGMFGRFRDVLWQQDHRWVVAADSADRANVLKPPADAFFDVLLELEAWPADRLIEMIERRAESEDEELAGQVIRTTALNSAGNPRDALRALLDSLLYDRDPVLDLQARAQLLDQASKIGRPEAMLMAELLDLGQASSSDESLQASLGLTRSRLTQLFRELLDHHLVTADLEHSDRPGRPRTVYRPALRR